MSSIKFRRARLVKPRLYDHSNNEADYDHHHQVSSTILRDYLHKCLRFSELQSVSMGNNMDEFIVMNMGNKASWERGKAKRNASSNRSALESSAEAALSAMWMVDCVCGPCVCVYVC